VPPSGNIGVFNLKDIISSGGTITIPRSDYDRLLESEARLEELMDMVESHLGGNAKTFKKIDKILAECHQIIDAVKAANH
jgi:hypothetical protein